LDTEPAIADLGKKNIEIRGRITFKDVTFTYPDTGIQALRGVSFDIQAGGTLAIVGHTGSGKSTIAELVGRLYDVTGGEILIDGTSIQDIPLTTLRGAIGSVPQDVFLFSENIRNNIAFSLDKGPDVDQRTEEAAKRAQVHENIIGFPNGYNTQLGERGITLSGGQKQRVSIARAIASRPRILIFDDALSAVDTATEEAILKGLRGASKGRTTVIISHRISAVRDADTIVVLEDGEVRESGDHTKLLAHGGLYTRLYEEQLLEEAREA